MDSTEQAQELLNQLQNLDPDKLDAASQAAAAGGFGSLMGFGMFSAMMSMWWSWVIGIISIVAMWFIFVKANKPGWAAIIPIYNVWVALEVIGKPWWWLILLFIPFVNIVMGILMCYHLAKVFNQGIGFTIGLILLPFIFMPILAWGDYKYHKPAKA